MTRVFLTGHSGFIGTYFLRYFENYFKIITFKKRINKENYSDLLNFESANVVVHAAAKTSISSSWSNPEKMIENNIGQLATTDGENIVGMISNNYLNF